MAAKKTTKGKKAAKTALFTEVEGIFKKYAKELAIALAWQSGNYHQKNEVAALLSEDGDEDDEFNLEYVPVTEEERRALLTFANDGAEPRPLTVTITIANRADVRKIRDEVDGSCLSESTKESILEALDNG